MVSSNSLKQSKVELTDPSVEFSIGTIPKSDDPSLTDSKIDRIVFSGILSTDLPN